LDVIFLKFIPTHLLTISTGFKPAAVPLPNPGVLVGANDEIFFVGFGNSKNFLKNFQNQ
jgi:hypothetical protein